MSQETCRYQVHTTPSREGEDVSAWLCRDRVRAASFFSVKGEAISLIHRLPHIVAGFLGAVLFVGVMFSRVQGQTSPADTSARDSLPSYLLQEVTVTSQRIPRPAITSPALAQVMTRRAIDLNGGTSLATILGPTVGLFIKDYGGPSSLKTISQRGLGAEHTLILLNGMPINSAHTGGFDLGLLSSFDIGSVEVVRGGQSALQGAHAVAGVVNILSRAMADGVIADAGATMGSFGYRQYHAAVGDGALPFRWRVSASHEESQENYPFTFTNGPQSFSLIRRNADMAVDRMTANVSAIVSPVVRLGAFAAYLDGERGVPGIVAGPYSASRARQTDRSLLMQLTATVFPASWWSWETCVQGVYTTERYHDPDLVIGYVPVDNTTTGREVHIDSHVSIDAAERTKVYAGLDGSSIRGEGNAYRSEVARRSWGASVALEHTLLGNRDAFHVDLFPAVRYDRVADQVEAWSPQCGAFVQMPITMPFGFRDASIRGRGMISRNFRAPTFNELYYAGGGGIGNPDLRPERSTGYEAGVGFSGRWWAEHHLDVTGFVSMMTDRIVWVPASGGNVTPRNLRVVDVRGVEIQYVLITNDLRIDVNYVRERSLKMSEDYAGDPNTHVPVIYAPEESAGLEGMWTIDPGIPGIRGLDLSARYELVGYRTITEDARDILPAYHVVGAGVGVHVSVGPCQARLKLHVENLLDASYQVMAGYPMPPRSVRFSFDLSY